MSKIRRAFKFNPSVRFRVVAIALIPSIALMIVGGGTADYFLRQAQSIQDWSDAINKTAGPALEFVEAVQLERRTSMLVLAGDTSASSGLAPERARLNAALPMMMAAGDDLIKLFSGDIGDAVTQMQATFGELPMIRQRIDLGAAQIDEVYGYYNKVIQTVIIAGRLAARTAKVPEAANEQDTEIGLFESAEAMSRSSALAAAASFTGGFTPAQQEEYSKLVGFYRLELDNRLGELTPQEMSAYQALVSNPSWRQMGMLEKSLLQRTATVIALPSGTSDQAPSTPRPAPGGGTSAPSTTPPGAGTSAVGTVRSATGAATQGAAPSGTAPSAGPTENGNSASSVNAAPAAPFSSIAPLTGWAQASDEVSSGLCGIWNSHLRYAGEVAEREGSAMSRTSVQLGLAALALSVFAFGAAVLLSHRLVRRLRRLRAETLAVSESRLPKIMDRLRRAESIDLDKEMPRLDFGRDEIGQVADAFNRAQRAAANAAVNEAQTRRGVQSVFVNIARRSQATMHQLLGQLEQAEHRYDDPDTLKMLFDFDNLATRERRNAENLVILGGERPGRQWRAPVPLHDLVRSAVTETEHYSRIQIVRLPNVPVIGAAVADLIHLLAELIDNAATFSPPRTRVEISGEMGGAGLIVEISDLGIGLAKSDLVRINEMLTSPTDFNVDTLSSDARLGLFVVGQLARRHQVAVRLTESDYGGIRSVVRLPYELVVVEGSGEPNPLDEIAERGRGELRRGAHRLLHDPAPEELSAASVPQVAAVPGARSMGAADMFAKPGGVNSSEPAVAHVGVDESSSTHYQPDEGPRLPQRKRQTTAGVAPADTRMPESHPSVRTQRDRPTGQGRPADLWTALQAGTKLGRSGVPVGSPLDPLSDNERQWND